MMDFKVTNTVEGKNARKDVPFTNPTERFYNAVGGEEGMRKLMYGFYDKIYESDIHNFFPQDRAEFDKIKEKNTKFFIEICGGPKIYDEAGGVELNEFMIHVHDDFSITDKARVEWLGCMKEAVEEFQQETKIDDDILQEFWNYVESFSKLTVNSFPKKEDFY
jgi:hemoglobin